VFQGPIPNTLNFLIILPKARREGEKERRKERWERQILVGRPSVSEARISGGREKKNQPAYDPALSILCRRGEENPPLPRSTWGGEKGKRETWRRTPWICGGRGGEGKKKGERRFLSTLFHAYFRARGGGGGGVADTHFPFPLNPIS